MTAIQDIENTKKRLIARAAKRGIWENFGQKERRKLQDKYTPEMCKNDDFHDVHRAIMEFELWCMNYDGGK